MIGISTVWRMKAGAKDAGEVLDPLLELGFSAIELDFRITAGLLQELIPSLKGHAPEAISIHNFCPVPDILPPHKASGDAFNLASLDKEERERAIRYTSRTLELAHELEVEQVVLHLGYVQMEGRKDDPQRAFREGRWTEEMRSELLREREEKAPPFIDNLLFSLERIIQRAEALGVRIGVENRYHLREIPLGEEIGRVLEEFKGGPIGYWHDTGHAAVLEALGVMEHRELLERYAQQIIGVHLHDARGMDDHLPPGKGEIDFQMVKEFLPHGAILIMEIHPPATGDEIIEGREFLEEVGIS